MMAAGLTTLETVLVIAVGYVAFFGWLFTTLCRNAPMYPNQRPESDRPEWVVDLDERRRQRADERRAADALRTRSGQVENVGPRRPGGVA